ncbi:SRPBCC family protein [Microbacterium invictum]|uniref:Carbon monoxide dehydrogenase subunit G n=1 Tax=Microbacterium invictum TaxID=515415 RepID=A0AA40SR26_9MICO|nr:MULTISPECIES: SRPBCC family protein [Microbacterium]MBB4140697.1 carbon monoxide dehydrogenase subunit G [Microbacterium invictum]
MNDEINESLDIDAPPAAVWAVVTDVRALPQILSGMTALAIEGDDPSMRVGLSWTQTRVIRGHTGSERLAVTAVEPGSKYATEGGGHGFDYVTTWTVEPLGADASRLTCTFRGIPRNWLARVMLGIFSGAGSNASRNAMRADLADIARAIEGGAR